MGVIVVVVVVVGLRFVVGLVVHVTFLLVVRSEWIPIVFAVKDMKVPRGSFGGNCVTCQ